MWNHDKKEKTVKFVGGDKGRIYIALTKALKDYSPQPAQVKDIETDTLSSTEGSGTCIVTFTGKKSVREKKLTFSITFRNTTDKELGESIPSIDFIDYNFTFSP